MSCLDFKNLCMYINNNEKFRSFKSKENIHKIEVGPYRGFSYKAYIYTPMYLIPAKKYETGPRL